MNSSKAREMAKRFFDEISKMVQEVKISSRRLDGVFEPDLNTRTSTRPTHFNIKTDLNLKAFIECPLYSLIYSLNTRPTNDLIFG